MNREVRNPEPEIRNPKSQIPNADSAMDDLLASFFRAEMPQPWPECSASSRIEEEALASGGCQHPGTESSTRVMTDPARQISIPHPRSSARSRWVLAASVAILLIGSWLLGQRFAALESTPSPTSSGKMIGSRPQPGKNKPPRHLSKTVVP